MRSRFLLGAVVLASVAAAAPAQAVVGGTESTQPYSFLGSFQPDYPAPNRPDHAGCGVSVLAPRWVLTASHCARMPTLPKAGKPKGWKVRIGSLNTTDGGEVAAVDVFYRLSSFREGIFGQDLTLMHLATPVRAKPIRLASATPADGTPTRILGWGNTNAEGAPNYPTHLREADTQVQPVAQCPEAVVGKELCIGTRDVRADNMDSGGPAVVRDGSDWVLAGTVSGPSSGGPVLYTDVTKHVDWINGIMSGNVPPLDQIPDVSGAVDLGSCVGSVVRTPSARPHDRALMLTNGHCLGDQRPEPGQALVDQPADLDMPVADKIGYPVVEVHSDRLVYATMTGTDIALYRLDRTYAQLAAKGAKVYDLTTAPMKAGDKVDMLTGGSRGTCTVEAVVPHLREGGYQEDNSVRYAPSDTCDHAHGYSGSALLSGGKVVGIHNTGNDSGEQCTDNNPCEVGPDGAVTSTKGRGYGQQVSQIAACFAGSRLDLHRYGCSLQR